MRDLGASSRKNVVTDHENKSADSSKLMLINWINIVCKPGYRTYLTS